MIKKGFSLGMLVIVLLFGITVIGCDEENGNTMPLIVTYSGTSNGTMYTLKITQNVDNRSVYTPVTGDAYELIAGTKKSNGTVVSFTSGLFVLQPSVPLKVTFNATVSGSNISDLSGTITWNDNTSDIGPGEMNGNNSGGTTDPALNGKWRIYWDVQEDFYDELTFENGNFELTGHYEGIQNFGVKGTCITISGKIIVKLTHVYGTTTSGYNENKWYTRAEVLSKHGFPDSEEFDADFSNKNYSVSGNTLTWGDIVYNRM